ncbi:MAG TPA: hypothetical protein PLN21_10195 [Gemmatales bacterium]|nr:hypothetical protein [Gemmatales bacterium]
MMCEEVQQWLLTNRSWCKDAGVFVSTEIAEHLAGCNTCQAFQKQEARFDNAVHQAMHEVAIPMELESSVLWKLRQARRQQQRSLVLYWSLAAAAAMLMAVCLNWYVQRPYDLARLHEVVAAGQTRRTVATYDVAKGRQDIDLQQWLQRQGVAVSIPSRLKVEHLTAAYIIEVGGRKIPVLEMRVGSSTSTVCLLQRRYFNEQLQKKFHDQDSLTSFVIADSADSGSLGWMIVDQGSAHLFVEGMVPQNGV